MTFPRTFLSKFTVPALVGLLLSSLASAQYTRTDLVAGPAPTAGANKTDPNLVNGWGITALPFAFIWVSDNATGKTTLYDGLGDIIPLVVSIPAATAGAQGQPTGTVGNVFFGINSGAFVVSDGLNPPTSGQTLFLFASLDGTISGWAPNVDPNGKVPAGGLSTSAVLAANRSDVGAVYTGLAIGSSNGNAYLYAADDGPNRRIDVFNSNFTLVQLSQNAFVDPEIPRDFAPYGVQNINGDIWVTYTALNNGQGGFVDKFASDGTLLQHFAVHGPLHSPWGLAQAPANFGPMSNAILVSNNIPRGRINAFDAVTGTFLGPLRDAKGQPIEIDDIWGIMFGQGAATGQTNQLFFTAGPNNYSNGLFGVITAN
jgi:uncharacterized protein (TIGR03118 family)